MASIGWCMFRTFGVALAYITFHAKFGFPQTCSFFVCRALTCVFTNKETSQELPTQSAHAFLAKRRCCLQRGFFRGFQRLCRGVRVAHGWRTCCNVFRRGIRVWRNMSRAVTIHEANWHAYMRVASGGFRGNRKGFPHQGASQQLASHRRDFVRRGNTLRRPATKESNKFCFKRVVNSGRSAAANAFTQKKDIVGAEGGRYFERQHLPHLPHLTHSTHLPRNQFAVL